MIESFLGAGFAKGKGENLPASWANLTAVGAQALIGQVAYAPLMLDDFKPSSDQRERRRQQTLFDNVGRSAVNGQSRIRSKQSGGLDESTAKPKCLIFSSGEDTPEGQSLNARIFRIELQRSLISEKLTAIQQNATNGTFAALTATFIQWIAPNIETILSESEAKIDAIRDRLLTHTTDMHGRSVTAVASFIYGWQTFLSFAVEKGGYTRKEADTLLGHIEKALLDNAREQQASIKAESGVEKFINTLNILHQTGKLRFASSASNAYDPNVMGEELGGYNDEEGVYLIFDACYKLVQQFLQATGEGIGESKLTLKKRLNEAGHIASADKDRLDKSIYKFGGKQTLTHLKPGVIRLRKSSMQEPQPTPEPNYGDSTTAADSTYVN